MSENVAIEFEGVGKMYRLYKSRLDSFLDITSLGRITPWWRPDIDNFWALRNVSFKLNAGSRLGIIGRNGAGKTTLLKLMTGNLPPTEGQIRVEGQVQALLEAGAGFHPEFTGYENIEASLIQNGLDRAQIKDAIEEIAEFTELGEFLNQPFKTYSAGMQARLVFTTATAIRPEILIIDEILGAGDAYFAVKSRSRMKELVSSGASVLLVAHAMDQILQFCDETIWLERGRIVLRGPSLEVVKAYEEFIHTLQDRQLKAANRRRRLGFRDAVEIGHFAETFVLALTLSGPAGARADISRVDLLWDEIAEETVRIGDPQDSDQTHFAYVALNTSTWSEPDLEQGQYFRSLKAGANGSASSYGEMVFRSYALDLGKRYTFRVRYRMHGNACLGATVSRNGQLILDNNPLPGNATEWRDCDIMLPIASAGHDELRGAAGIIPGELIVSQRRAAETASGEVAEASRNGGIHRGELEKAQTLGESSEIAELAPKGKKQSEEAKLPVRRWPGEGTFLIDDVVLRDAEGKERAVYQVGSSLTLHIRYHATKTGSFPFICAVAIYRIDGIKITQHISSCSVEEVSAGERRFTALAFPAMDLADGRYMITVSLHRDLDPQFPNETVRYDLLAYSYEFQIVGNPPLRNSLFVLPASWTAN